MDERMDGPLATYERTTRAFKMRKHALSHGLWGASFVVPGVGANGNSGGKIMDDLYR